MEKVFAYGTLLQPDVQQNVFNRVLVGIPSSIRGYEVCTVVIDGEEYPSLRESHTAEVKGEIFTLTDEELQRADVYEGVEYTRKRILTEHKEECWVYSTFFS